MNDNFLLRNRADRDNNRYAQQFDELIAPNYSWDVSIGSSSLSSDQSQAVKKESKQRKRRLFSFQRKDSNEEREEDQNLSMEGSSGRVPEMQVRGMDNEQDERIANHLIEALLSRVRSVGEAPNAPESVHDSTRRMGRRKSLAPQWSFNPTAEYDSRLSKRAKDTILARSPTPASVDQAMKIVSRDGGIGPQAHIQSSDFVDVSLSIGTASLGGLAADNGLPVREPFSVFLPPPFRIVFLIALGLLCWSANLRGLRRLGLDAESMMSSETKVRVLPHHRDHGEQLYRAHANAPARELSRPNASTAALVGSADSELAVFFRHPGPQEAAAFHLGLSCFVWASICWVTYRVYAFKTIFYGGDQINGISNARGRHAQAIQGIAVLGVLAVAFWPGDVMYRPMRKAFGRQILCICKPSFVQRIHFSNVVLADILTSYARVFGELWLTMCFLWPKTDTPAWWNGKGSVAVPLLVSLPYFIRFRQCLSEYNVSTPSMKDGKRPLKPLLNAAKYASAFPVIWLSVLQGANIPGDGHFSKVNMFFYLWIGSVFINSFYSFWWDVTNDWGLEMLKWETWANTPSLVMRGVHSIHRRNTSAMPAYLSTARNRRASDTSSTTVVNETANGIPNGAHERTSQHSNDTLRPGDSASNYTSHSRKKSYFLRPPEYVMLFPPIVYQLAVTSDLILRFAWSLKLSSHLHHIIELESTAFYLEALEILRRWGWSYLRIEWEACKRRTWESEGSMESLTLSTLRSDSHLHHRD